MRPETKKHPNRNGRPGRRSGGDVPFLVAVDDRLIDPNDDPAARLDKPHRQGSPRNEWVISTGQAHPALVSEQTFVAAQKVSARATPTDAQPCRYLLVGLVVCALCGRHAESRWAHGRPAYRCRHGTKHARPAEPSASRPLDIREDTLLGRAAAQLDLLTGAGQTLWPDTDLAAYLRRNDLTLRDTHDGTTIVGALPSDQATTENASDDKPQGIHRHYRKFLERNIGATENTGRKRQRTITRIELQKRPKPP